MKPTVSKKTVKTKKSRPSEARSDALSAEALRCLYIAIEKDVADDVVAKVRAYTDMLEASNKEDQTQ